MPTLGSVARLAASALFHPQVFIEFPLDVIAEKRKRLSPLKPGFEMRPPRSEADYSAWAALLNEEPGFGSWTPDRIRTELGDRLIDPNAASLLFHDGKAVGCGCVVDASTRTRRIAHGMFLYIQPAYRGIRPLAQYMTFQTLGICVDRGYEQVVASTDPTRLSALLLYLSNGCRPVRNSLYSYIQWHRIQKRLAPTLAALERRKSRAPADR